MARTTFYFVAGEQVMTKVASTVLDAWLMIEKFSRTTPIAREFRELKIAAHSDCGEVIATRTWDQWHAELMRDTYGSNWREMMNEFSEAIGHKVE